MRVPTDPLRSLRLFNRKAAKLDGLEFTKLVRAGTHGVRLSLDHDAVVGVDRAGPGAEAIDAFLLTFRFFVQDNEPSSFANLAAAYERLDVDDETKAAVRRVRNKVNSYLDGPSNVEPQDARLTRRYVFEVFMWGGCAHADETKESIYDTWARSSIYLALEDEFVVILTSILSAIAWFQRTNTDVLALYPAPEA